MITLNSTIQRPAAKILQRKPAIGQSAARITTAAKSPKIGLLTAAVIALSTIVGCIPKPQQQRDAFDVYFDALVAQKDTYETNSDAITHGICPDALIARKDTLATCSDVMGREDIIETLDQCNELPYCEEQVSCLNDISSGCLDVS